jgi:signal transduction histidine kinase
LEDNELDHQLVVAQLDAEGFDVQCVRVDSRENYLRELENPGCVDLILADYTLPHFDGATALRLARAHCPDAPFIIVSGAMGEIAAVEILKAGATDYVLKDHLERLAPAVRRALREATERSARRQAEREVREARDAAQAANRAKDHFLAVLSHELRTPLTPALTAIQEMEGDPSLPESLREPVQMIRRNIQLEVKLIDDLLDLTRISRGKLELNLQPSDAHQTIRQVLAICDSDIRGKSQTVDMQLDATEHVVLADPARFHQVLWNLLKNAVKFTAEGGRITVRSRSAGEQFEVSISDSGIGIEPQMLPRIFDAFEQGGQAITRQFGGVGLGLAISRAIVEQHHGRLTASSDGVGKGATFTLELPVTSASTAESTQPCDGEDQAGALHRRRILLVDDHVDTTRAMARVLRNWGCVVQTADSVATALQVAGAGAMPFDILISDIGLPDGSGLDLIRQLRSRYPILGIAVSGFGMEQDVEQSRRAGFTEHLVKPIELPKLETALRRALTASPVAVISS